MFRGSAPTRRPPRPRQQRDYLSKAQSASRRLLRLINDVLDSSKIEAGGLELEQSEFRLDELFGELADIFQAQAGEKGLGITFPSLPERPYRLLGDPMRLNQILTNLLSNAVKFTEAGRVVVECALQEEWKGGVCLAFSVQDTGIGMSEAQCRRLFRPFTQADVSTTRRYGGTGLGLTITRQLVAMMGGEITVDSILGQGSRFRFTLRFPTRAAPLPDPTPAESNDPPVPPQSAGIQGAAVLVVEDNSVNRAVAEGLLQRAGARVQCAHNGAEAVEAVLRHRFDAVLMDLEMPVMDGYAATAEIRRRPQGAGLPILAMTASTLSGDRERCLAAGMDDYIAKPVRPADLYATLQRWIGPRDGGTLLPAASHADDLPDLPGIDQTRGLYQVAGDHRLYGALLRQFRDRYQHVQPELRAALAAGDLPSAARAAHTLKGVAGSLGATRLFETATALDQAFKGHDLEGAAGLIEGRLQEDLGELLAGLAGLPEPAAGGAAVSRDPASLAPRLRELRGLLEAGDFQAIECFAGLRAALAERLGVGASHPTGSAEGGETPPLLWDLDRQIRACDFEQALQTFSILQSAVAAS